MAKICLQIILAHEVEFPLIWSESVISLCNSWEAVNDRIIENHSTAGHSIMGEDCNTIEIVLGD